MSTPEIAISELPENCVKCPCHKWGETSNRCGAGAWDNYKIINEFNANKSRHKDCPLILLEQWRLESCETCNGLACGQVWNKGITKATCCDWQPEEVK